MCAKGRERHAHDELHKATDLAVIVVLTLSGSAQVLLYLRPLVVLEVG